MEFVSERCIDELGRIVLPIEVRKKLHLQPGNSLMVCLDSTGCIVLCTPKQWEDLQHKPCQ